MLNEFAGMRKVSDKSLGRDETPGHTSHEIWILHKYLTIFIAYYIIIVIIIIISLLEQVLGWVFN